MSSSPSSIHLRHARQDEIPTMIRIGIDAFRGAPINSALFPEHLRVNPGDVDQQAWREKSLSAVFEKKNWHHIVAVDADGNVVGWAQWTSADDPPVVRTPEERKQIMASYPPSLDLNAGQRLGEEAEVLENSIKEALGAEGYKHSWHLNSISVDPSQQRRGIGKMLTQWGVVEAQKEGKNIHFLASPAGAILYRTLSFELVATGKIMGGDQYAFVKRFTSTT